MLIRELREVSFDDVNAPLHILFQFVHPKSADFPSQRSQLMISPMVVDFSMTIHVLMKLPTVNFEVKFYAAHSEQCKVKPPACDVVLRLGIKTAGTQGMINDAFPFAVEYRLTAALSRLGGARSKGCE